MVYNGRGEELKPWAIPVFIIVLIVALFPWVYGAIGSVLYK